MKKIVVISIISAVALLAIGATGPCRGAESWALYYQSETEKYYYDKATLTTSPQGNVTLSRKITSLGKGIEETTKSIERIEMNCKALSYRIIPEKVADSAASKEAVKGKGKEAGWTEFSIQSVMGSLFQNVCQKARGKEKPKEIY